MRSNGFSRLVTPKALQNIGNAYCLVAGFVKCVTDKYALINERMEAVPCDLNPVANKECK